MAKKHYIGEDYRDDCVAEAIAGEIPDRDDKWQSCTVAYLAGYIAQSYAGMETCAGRCWYVYDFGSYVASEQYKVIRWHLRRLERAGVIECLWGAGAGGGEARTYSKVR